MGMACNLQVHPVGGVAACHFGLVAQQNVQVCTAGLHLSGHGLHIGGHAFRHAGVGVLRGETAIGRIAHARNCQLAPAHMQHLCLIGQIVQVQALKDGGPGVVATVVLVVARC